MKFTRVFAMPNSNTFEMRPLKSLILRYTAKRKLVIDPFARNSNLADVTNDLNPQTKAQFHMDAISFLRMQSERGVRADVILLDPPYSPRQVSECYQNIGRTTTMHDTQSGFWTAIKDAADNLAKRERERDAGTVVICCGWNSGGMGIGRGYQLLEVMLIHHGGSHNDTIVTVERKV